MVLMIGYHQRQSPKQQKQQQQQKEEEKREEEEELQQQHQKPTKYHTQHQQQHQQHQTQQRQRHKHQRQHQQLLTILVFMLVLFCNCVISRAQQLQQQQQRNVQRNDENFNNDDGVGVGVSLQAKLQSQQQQQQQQQSLQSTSAKSTTSNANNDDDDDVDSPPIDPKDAVSVVSSADGIVGLHINNDTTSINQQQQQQNEEHQQQPPSIITNGHGRNEPAAATTTTTTTNNKNNTAKDAVVDSAHILPTTYRPARPSIAPHPSAQDRERQLMSVLAARRSVLQRGPFRTRAGTTGRTAISSSTSSATIETTSKSPTDPRSICIRNCTKNFTRRTTASCMRQCANFSRTPQPLNSGAENSIANSSSGSSSNGSAGATSVFVRASSKSGAGTTSGDRDNNEILFTDESSHGLFVVAKDLNDTLNHIPNAAGKNATPSIKTRTRGKPLHQLQAAVTPASSSVEDDDIQPYLYFGQKLPPLKPATLTITSVSDEHPKLLEVSVAKLATTTPANRASSSTLSAVERSRSRYKYNMRDRGSVTFQRRVVSAGSGGGSRTVAALGEPTAELKPASAAAMAISVNDSVAVSPSPAPQESAVTREAQTPVSSTPLIITVLSDEEEATPTYKAPAEVATMSTLAPSPPATTSRASAEAVSTTTATTAAPIPSTTAAAAAPIPSTTVTSSTTPPSTAPPMTSPTTTSTTTTTTTIATTSSKAPSTTTTTTSTTSTTRTTSTSIPSTTTSAAAKSSSTSKFRNIIEEETESLRALAPILTQEYGTDDNPNLVVFLNLTTATPTLNTTTPRPGNGQAGPTTDSSSTILRTTILTSVRSTVHPRTSERTPSDRLPAANLTTFVGVVETASAPGDLGQADKNATPSPPTAAIAGNDISSTAVADERDINIDMKRVNIATMVLAGIGIFPLSAVIIFLIRSYILRRNAKDNEVFDVCVTDQQPISPVKKLDSKFGHNDEDDTDGMERGGHHQHQHQQHQQHHHQHQHQQHQHQNQHQPKVNLSSIPMHSHNHSDYNHSNHHRYDEQCSETSEFREFDRGNIRLKSLLGEGNFGQVWKAEADDLSGHFGATRIVAVKTIRACSAQVSLKDEANIMRKLGSHQNVVTLLGACVETEPHMLIMEYAMRGRLLSLLRAARSASNILPASVPGGRSLTPLSPRTLGGFALDIACGMEYIANKQIVHRDLAARNVLIDHNGVCKICDFGMSIDLDAERKRKEHEKNIVNETKQSSGVNKFKFDFAGRFIINHWSNNFSNNNSSNNNNNNSGSNNNNCANGSAGQGPQKETNEKKGHGHGHGHDTIGKRHALPIRWMAPEALLYHVFTTETDVWAFGIVLWEIATLGSTPYSHLTGREVIRRVPGGQRPDLPKEGRHEFYNLMSRCWNKEPQLRPSFTQARLEISRSLHKWVDDDSAASDYMDVSGFSEDLEHGMVYFNHRISEFECEI